MPPSWLSKSAARCCCVSVFALQARLLLLSLSHNLMPLLLTVGTVAARKGSSVNCSAITGQVATVKTHGRLLYGVYSHTAIVYESASLTAGPPGSATTTYKATLLSDSSTAAVLSVLLLLPNKLPICSCSVTVASRQVNCTDFLAPKPPWPAFPACKWKLLTTGQLVEVNRLERYLSCVDSATMSVDKPAQFSPPGVSMGHSPTKSQRIQILQNYALLQEFNGTKYKAHVADAYMNGVEPVRIAIVNDTVNSAGRRVLHYRRLFGWSRHCLHVCRAVFKKSVTDAAATDKQTCQDLDEPPEMKRAKLPPTCQWAFTVDCQPVKIALGKRAVPCEPEEEVTSTPVSATNTPDHRKTRTTYTYHANSSAKHLQQQLRAPDDSPPSRWLQVGVPLLLCGFVVCCVVLGVSIM